jgi:hypothetical protein
MFHILAESGLCIMLNYLFQNNIKTFWIWIIFSYTIHVSESGLCIMLNYLYQNNIETFWIWIIFSYTIHVSQSGQICTAWFCFWNTCICNFKKLNQFGYDIIYWFSSSWFHAWITNYYCVIHLLFIFMDNISIKQA